ncbi:MAG: DUF3365 domain-containing protein [Bacteroidales bacterium]|nr:DUF3365 domain-containing protein [Bacteroidales bacterium]
MRTPKPIVLLVFFAGTLVLSCAPRTEQESVDKAAAEIQEAAILAHHQQLGDSLVSLAQAEMFQAVSSAMQSGGPAHATDFCNIHAPGIVMDLAKQWNCEIRRTSLKARNPENRPNEDELKILNWYAGLEGQAMTSTVWRDGDKVHYASPITMKMPACLSCHGSTGGEIEASTLVMIQEKYPEDQAIDYKLNDFRGMWHLTFEPEANDNE